MRLQFCMPHIDTRMACPPWRIKGRVVATCGQRLLQQCNRRPRCSPLPTARGSSHVRAWLALRFLMWHRLQALCDGLQLALVPVCVPLAVLLRRLAPRRNGRARNNVAHHTSPSTNSSSVPTTKQTWRSSVPAAMSASTL